MKCDDDVTSYLLDRMDKKEVDTRGPEGYTCLLMAVMSRQSEAMKRLVHEFHAAVDAQCDEGHTAICYAIDGENKEAVDFLLEHARAQGGDERRQALLNDPCPCLPGHHLVFHAINTGIDFNLIPVLEHLLEKEGKERILYNTFAPSAEALGLLPHHFAITHCDLFKDVIQCFFGARGACGFSDPYL